MEIMNKFNNLKKKKWKKVLQFYGLTKSQNSIEGYVRCIVLNVVM